MKTRPALLRSFLRHQKGASAIEFALVASPFFLLLLFILQIGVYYMMQMSLDRGILFTAESLRAQFGTGTTPVMSSATVLKATAASNSGGLIPNGSALAVEIQPLSNLNGSVVAVTDGLTNYGSANTVLVLRARYTPTTFMPGFSGIIMSSSAIVRRGAE